MKGTEAGESADDLEIGGRRFTSRLFVGTGKYADFRTMAEALAASGTEVVTVAVRRVNLTDSSKESLLDYVDRSKYMILPNTAGCFTADDAIRAARLAREVGLSDFVKLEVLGDKTTLMPDTLETLKATEILVKEGFKVMAYTSDDPMAARRLEEAGAVSVMPLGAPIGSGLGILNPTNISMIVAAAKVPIIVDAGVGTASDVAIAMELGAQGVLLNTGVALARDPVRMARAMKLAVQAGRLACLAGRIPRKSFGSPSSPVEGVIGR